MQFVTYYFGRLNIIFSTNLNRITYLIDSLRSEVHILNRDFEWSLFEVDEAILNNETFMYGCLYKRLFQELHVGCILLQAQKKCLSGSIYRNLRNLKIYSFI